MAYRLYNLEFKNFKFFKDTFDKFKIEGKNVLLYGENGSGKSSISWGLYTLMESRRKSEADVKKYFTATEDNDQHLCNLYEAKGVESYVKALFKDNTKPVPDPAPEEKVYIVSQDIVNTQVSNDTFLDFTTAAYDYFSYRTLGEYTYQKNSAKLDLFDVLERDVFAFLNLDGEYKIVNGQQVPMSALEKWKELKGCQVPKSANGTIDVESQEYINLRDKLKSFADLINSSLYIIQREANRILKSNFDLDSIKLNVVMQIPTIGIDGMVQNPSVIVTAQETNSKVEGWHGDIIHLATYFNEARLTCIGLALRLAISNKKLITSNNAPILCIDDVLLSMDMGNRLKVMNLFLELAQTRQLLIFTHDRSFFESMKKLIIEEKAEKAWKNFEMYVDSDGPYPTPRLSTAAGDEEKAVLYMHNGDYPTSANYLRKFAESELKKLLPKNLQLTYGKDGTVTAADLRALIGAVSTFSKLYGCDIKDIPSLDFYRERLMNPFSHDDIKTPIYRGELEDCLGRIRKIKAINETKVQITDGKSQGKINNFQIGITNGPLHEFVKFRMLEPLDYFVITKKDATSARFYRNGLVRVTECPSNMYAIEQRICIKELYTQVITAVGFDDANPAPPFDDTVIQVEGGKRLQML